MATEVSIVDKLVGELDKQTEPYAAWKGAKGEIQKGTGATRANAAYTKEVKGAKAIDQVEAYAVDFYGGKTGDAKELAHMLRIDLGDNYGQFRAALKQGDVDTANKLARDAGESRYLSANLEGTVERLSQLSPDERIAAAKKMVTKAHGNDYVAAATNPGQLARVLTQQKLMAETYRWN